MYGVSQCEAALIWLRLPTYLRPALGGLVVGALALVSPQVLSSGHGAIHMAAMIDSPLRNVLLLFLLKAAASMVSLGSGFRGGLFFASLLLGALGGRLFAEAFSVAWPAFALDPHVYAIIGMGAFSVSVIGGPLTMTFIALETTGDLWLTTAVLVAVIVSAQVTREAFGYSFATWRFHLRGESIRSAADVGWLRDLTVRRMMRPDVRTVPANTTLSRFRTAFPLGSNTHVVAVDENKHYAGIAAWRKRMPPSSTIAKPIQRHSPLHRRNAAADHDGQGGGGRIRQGRGRGLGRHPIARKPPCDRAPVGSTCAKALFGGARNAAAGVDRRMNRSSNVDCRFPAKRSQFRQKGGLPNRCR